VGIAVLSGLLVSACAIIEAQSVELADSHIRVRDVAVLGCLDPALRGEVGALTIAAMPRNTRQVTLSADALATLIRRRAPALASVDSGAGARAIEFRRRVIESEHHRAAQANCIAAAQYIAAGRALSSVNTIATPCRADAGPAPIRFDRRAGLARANTDVAAGAYLGQLFAPSGAFADTGDELVLVVARGPVRIERRVWAAQPALGAAVFVRDEDGNAFRARILPQTGGAQ
jgi:hypothetical protein